MSVKLLFNLLLVLSASAFGQSPAIDWQVTYGGTLSDYGRRMIATSDGGFLFIGGSSSSDIDLTINNGDIDIWVVKTNATGELVWQKSYGGSGLELCGDIVETSDGYAFAATAYSNDGDVIGHHGLNGDFWLVKLDYTGQIQWQKCIGDGNHEIAKGIKVTNDGGFIVVGGKTLPITIGPTSTYTDEFYIVKVDSVGNEQWSKIYGGTYEEVANDVIQTVDGNYIVVGETASDDGDVAFNHATGSFHGDFWILKLSETGEILWQKSLGGTGYEIAYRVAKANDGYVIVGDTTSNDGDLTGYHNLDDAWIVKISEAGDFIWQKVIGGNGTDYIFDVIESIDGGFVVAGESNSNDGDLSGNHGGYDAWTAKLDAFGNLEWSKLMGGTAKDNVFGLFQTPDEGYLFTGFSASNNGDLTENNGGWDMWIVKLLSENLSAAELQVSKPIVYPSPATSIIQFSKTIEWCAVTDITGKIVYTSEDRQVINIESLSPGIYFVEVSSGGKVFQSKFIKQ